MNEKVYSSYELADLGSRFIAAFIDGIILALVGSVVFSILRDPAGIVSLVLFVLYDWYFWTRYNGQTPGKMVMKLKVVKKDGSPIGDADAIVRAVVWHFGAAAFGIGLLWAIWDDNRQGWHDKMAGTYVVKANSEVVV